MALLTDPNLVTLELLLPYESDLLETSDRERVEAATKIELAIQEIRTETEIEFEKLIRNGSETEYTSPSLGSVVATPPLLRWIYSRTLELFYFECYGHQLNPRFKEKYEHYRDRGAEEKASYFRRGIGVVRNPLPKPDGATAAYTAGAIPAGVCYFAYTWTNSLGQESALSDVQAVAVSGTQGVQIAPGQAPGGASGWNVYVGDAADSLHRQNSLPLALGAFWQQIGAVIGPAPFTGSGQEPERFIQPRHIFLRG